MIGQAIRVVREELHMSAREMSNLVGVSPSYYSRIESGKRNASTMLLASIDQVALDRGVPSNLVGIADVDDPTARDMNTFMARYDISDTRKDAVRRLARTLLRVE